MSENATEATPVAESEDAPETETVEAAPEAEIDWKAKSREWEKRAKSKDALINQLKPKADEFSRLEEASKSESQRLSETAETAKREAGEARAEALRYKIALKHGISEDDFDLLGSGDEDQIEARAAKIAAKNEAAKQAALDAAVTTPTAPAPRRPVESLRPGASPSADPVQSDDYYPSDWLTPTQRARVEAAGA